MIAKRFVCGLQHLNDAQPGVPVIDWRLIFENALVEISEFEFECFRVLNLRRQHVARAVANEQIIDTLAVVHVYAAVIDLDLLVGFEVVPHQHLLITANQRSANLYRRKPVYVDVRNQLVRVVNGNVGNVLNAVDVFLSGCDDCFGLIREQVVHDGQVVGRKSQMTFTSCWNKPRFTRVVS